MFKHSDISTYVSKTPFIFTLLSLIVSTIVSILMFLNRNALAIFAGIMFLILAIASLFVLFGMLNDYAYIENDILNMHYLFKKSSIMIKDIKYIEYKDNLYKIYDDKNEEVGTINALALGVDDILRVFYLNKITMK